MMDPYTLRQAAILVASLDTEQSEGLLARLDTHERERIRQTILSLSAEDLSGSETVIEEFLANYAETPDEESLSSEPGQSEHYDSTLPTTEAEAVPKPANQTDSFTPHQSSDLQFLYQVSPPNIAQFLSNVHKQIAATVLSRIPADFSGVILSYFPAGEQAEILERIANSSRCHPAQLHLVTRLMQDCLAQKNHELNLPQQNAAAAIEIVSQDNFLNRTLSAMESNGTELSSLEHLHVQKRTDGPVDACSRSLQRETQYPVSLNLRFEDIALLDDKSLAHLFHQIDHQTLLLALAGAASEVIQRITSPLSAEQAQRFMVRLEAIEGVSLCDIEKAQQTITELTVRLVKEAKVQFTEQKRFQAAA